MNNAVIPKPIPEDSPELTVDQLKAVMPARQKGNITQNLVDELNQIMVEPEYREYYRNNFLGYMDILQDPNVRMVDYVKAVKYCSYRLMGYTNQESWCRTFPERHQRLLADGKPETYLRSLVSIYNKGKTVQRIMEQAQIPTWLLNADLFQKALNQQAVLMQTAKSEKVRSEAADSILRHLKRPEEAKLKLDVTVEQDDSVKRLSEAMAGLVEAQRDAILSGDKSVLDIAEGNIIDVTPEDAK